MSETKHLWEIDHPYYGVDGYSEDVESFAELREQINQNDKDMNLVYRWDWNDYSQPHHDTLFLAGEDRSGQKFTVYLLMPRKQGFWSLSCPITHEEEAEVLEWLRGPRVLGHMRKLWEPLLGEVSA